MHETLEALEIRLNDNRPPKGQPIRIHVHRHRKAEWLDVEPVGDAVARLMKRLEKNRDSR